MAETLYPVAEVAELWRCSRQHVYNLVRRGKLRTTDLGLDEAKTRIPESALAEYVKRNTARSPR